MYATPDRTLSGIQPTGTPHLGNYFGAIEQHIALQDQYPGECFYFIADYHALTTVHDGDTLRANVREVARTYLALGLDPQRATLFRQSDVPEVTELTWFLASVTGMGLLERAHAYKDKIARGMKPNVGLFLYPVLMAADILAYRPSLVPVGKDQMQHVEMTQDMATYFNQAFAGGEPVLRRPEGQLSSTPVVPGLDGQKMSKSYGNTISMFDSGKALRKRVGKIVTDSTPLGEPLKTEGCHVLGLLGLFKTNAELDEIKTNYRTATRNGQPFGYGHAKQLLAEAIETRFDAARQRHAHFTAHPDELDAILARGAERARGLARQTLQDCKKACGLR
ncbi:MAG: tryptophan--tRNA ligase [Myxococcales bacterium FL481]|nr:MAG: tryptophan--tRNA ligase [Myxococcales bacterium FL481]